ncbi:MAG: ferredoxin [Lentisphaeraceae bacterium]|nr:ferredoxin [Lentisphaeraceae bacterium]
MTEAIIHPQSVKGEFFCTSPDDINSGCIHCGLCYASVPEVFAEDEDGAAFVHKQPDEDLRELVEETLTDCPIGSIQRH